ncbi:MAG TPA: hypothetical protein VM618_13530 [Acidimicrobiia bacterium]|nr:hypothetical protein [Acidimicrobiia bacterium]
MPVRVPRFALLAVAAGLVVLPACGDDDGAVDSGAPSTRPSTSAADLTVVADDIKFPQDHYTATAGELTVAYENAGAIPHTLVIETTNGETVEGWERLQVDKKGDVAVGSVTLEPGDYRLYCDIAGHRANGMEATFEVEP